MRILMTTDYFWPQVMGGVERVVLETSRRLVAAGHAVTVLTLRYPGQPDQDVHQGVRIVRMPALALTGVVRLQLSVSPALIARSRALLKQIQPDVVHCHNLFFPSSVWMEAAARLSRLPVVLTMHVASVRELRGVGGLGARAYLETVGRFAIRAAHRVVAVSEAVAAEARRLGVKEQRLRLIHNGVDTNRFHPQVSGNPEQAGRDPTPALEARRPIILSVGRFIENKGPHLLVDAAGRLAARGHDFDLLFVGEGPLRSALEAQATQAGIADRCTFVQTTPNVEPYFRAASLLVRPSLTEGMPLTVLEAMASAVPVVASAVGGTPELVKHGETGLLVLPSDVAALASAIERLLVNPAEARHLGAAGRQFVLERFSWEATTSAHEDLYRTLCRDVDARRRDVAHAPHPVGPTAR